MLAHGEGERVAFGEILHSLHHRAFGFATLIFSLPCCLPMPPGVPTLCGIALVIIALNLMAMRRRLWLPTAIAGRTIARADLQRMVGWGTPITQRIERYCRPRLPEMTESVGKVLSSGLGKKALGALWQYGAEPALSSATKALPWIGKVGQVALSDALKPQRSQAPRTAPTPTAAAELATPDKGDLRERLFGLAQRLGNAGDAAVSQVLALRSAIDALASGRLRAAGLDVFDGEPQLHPGYRALTNAFLLPHLGTATIETRTAMGFRALDNLDAFFAGQPPRDRVV